MAATVYEFTVDEDGDAYVLARLYKKNSSHALVAAVAADFTAITYQVTSLKDGSSVVAETSLTASDVVLSALSTGSVWTRDSTGFNFIHLLPAASFPSTAGYRIRYKFTLSGGTVFFLKVNVNVLANN